MGAILDFFKNQFEKIKRYFSGNKNMPTNEQNNRIVIRSRRDAISTGEQRIQPIQNNQEEFDTPKITIRSVNQRTPMASGTNVYRSEVDVQNANLGRGITVMRQHKPGRCPLCATRGEIIENPEGRPRWKCTTCDSTFN